jgi:predicted dehydrogenase
MRPVRLAVVGIKGMGREHIRAISAVEGTVLATVCDVDAEAARACSEDLGVPCYADYGQMLSKEASRLDGVALSTPHPLHAGEALAAFEAGLHVLTEKPMAVTVGEADGMIEAARRAKRKLGVIFQQRTEPRHAAARKLVAEGRLGEIGRTLLVTSWFRTNAYFRSAPWRGTWRGEGGGILLNQAQHQLDLLQWIAGMTPDRVEGEIETVAHGIEVEDRASALLHYPNGATGYVHASTVEAPSRTRMEFAGDRGRLVIEGEGLELTVLDGSSREFIEASEERSARMGHRVEGLGPLPEPEGRGHEPVIADFARAVRTGREPMVPGEEGRKALELANAIVLSSHRGEPVSLPVPRKVYSDLVRILAGRKARRRRRK